MDPMCIYILDLIMKEQYNKFSSIKDLVTKAKKIVSFTNNHGIVRDTFDVKSDLRLIKPAATRFYTNYILLQRLCEVEAELVATYSDPKVKKFIRTANSSVKATGQDVHTLISDTFQEFWPQIRQLVNWWSPLVGVIRFTDRDSTGMSKLYLQIEKLKLDLSENPLPFLSEAETTRLLSMVETRLNRCLTDFHYAAHLLDPRHHSLLPRMTEPMKKSLRRSLKKMLGADDGKSAFEEFASYREKSINTSYDARDDMWDDVKNQSGRKWWSMYGNEDGMLKIAAMKLLSQTCSSGAAERNWSTFSIIQTKRRNRMKHDLLNMFVFVHTNMKLRQQQSQRNETEVEFPQWLEDVLVHDTNSNEDDINDVTDVEDSEDNVIEDPFLVGSD
ncbi:hypothetical protein GEMRC1_010231 [Eukaryota sp. GEM-RC1]